MRKQWNCDLPDFYSGWAPDYARQFCNELDYKPRDQELLTEFAAAAPDGLICDLGCGPAHIGGYLCGAGRNVEGIDIAPGMINIAQELYPGLSYQVGDFLNLPVADENYSGVVAFYSLIHNRRDQLSLAFKEIRRVLQVGGLLLASFHEGTHSVLKDTVTFNFFTREEIETGLSELLIMDDHAYLVLVLDGVPGRVGESL